MISGFSFSEQGMSHKNLDVPCQDRSKFKELSNGWVAAAVADGVSSSSHSDVAAEFVCNQSLFILESFISSEVDDLSLILPKMKQIFMDVDSSLRTYVISQDGLITDYDTTFDMVVYDGHGFVYGHSGDGGIIEISNGKFSVVTKPFTDEECMSVIPFRSGGENWSFGYIGESVDGILLLTDGVYNYLVDSFNNTLKLDAEKQLNLLVNPSESNAEYVHDNLEIAIRVLVEDFKTKIVDDITIVYFFHSNADGRLTYINENSLAECESSSESEKTKMKLKDRIGNKIKKILKIAGGRL